MIAADGTVRQAHYGTGHQPWDTIRLLGWAPQFAAGNIVKYLRRTKDPEHSLASARWYYAELVKMIDAPRFRLVATGVLAALRAELTDAELALLA